MNQPELGRKINEIRNRNGITQKDLSEKCNIDIRTIQRIESGEVFPRASTLKLISEILGLDYYAPFHYHLGARYGGHWLYFGMLHYLRPDLTR